MPWLCGQIRIVQKVLNTLRCTFAEQGHHDDNQSDNDCTYPEYQAIKEKEEAGCSITVGE